MLTSGHLVAKTNKDLKIKRTLDLQSVFQGSESILFRYLNEAMLAASTQWRTDLTLAQCTDHAALKWIGLLKPCRSSRTLDSCFLITCKIFFLEMYHDLTYSQGSFSHVFCFSVLAPRRRTENVSCFPQKVAVKKVNFYWPNQANIPGINLQCISLQLPLTTHVKTKSKAAKAPDSPPCSKSRYMNWEQLLFISPACSQLHSSAGMFWLNLWPWDMMQ